MLGFGGVCVWFPWRLRLVSVAFVLGFRGVCAWFRLRGVCACFPWRLYLVSVAELAPLIKELVVRREPQHVCYWFPWRLCLVSVGRQGSPKGH